MRTVDPDNEVSYTSNFTTKNKIAYQLPNTSNKTLVTASGLQYQNSYLGLGTKDCQAKCFILPAGLFPLADLVSIYDGTASGYIYADSSTRDVGIGLIFKIGSLAPGDSTTFSYAYILNENDLDEAFTQTEPGFSYNGNYYPSGSVITQPTGTVLPVDIVNGSYYNWTWAPPTFLDVTTGTHVNATVSTGPVTYTVTGVGSGSISTLCSNKLLTITISPFSVSPPPTVTGPVTYCLNAVANALIATGTGIIRWYTSATGGVGSLIAPIPSTSSPGTTTWYVTQEISGTESIRIPVIVHVMPLPTIVITPASASICQGDFVQLTASGAVSYSWNASVTLNTTVGATVIASPMNTTTYVVKGTDANSCQKSDSVTVTANPLPKPDLGVDKSICLPSNTVLSPGNFKNYLWHDNSTQPGYPVNTIGAYWVKVENNFGCTASDTINIISFFENPENFLPANTSFCKGNQHVISVPGYAEYLWDDGSILPSIAIKRFGQITLTVKDNNGCYGTDSMTLFDAKCIRYALPNAFTPNNDGKNDVFRIYLTQIVTDYKITIWNRWGEIVFTSTEPQKGWDGSNKGKEQPSGTYVYTISFTDSDRLPVNLNGTVNIIR
jgi:gliding motility-associated-like protein